jgi:hypothetical protein
LALIHTSSDAFVDLIFLALINSQSKAFIRTKAINESFLSVALTGYETGTAFTEDYIIAQPLWFCRFMLASGVLLDQNVMHTCSEWGIRSQQTTFLIGLSNH